MNTFIIFILILTILFAWACLRTSSAIYSGDEGREIEEKIEEIKEKSKEIKRKMEALQKERELLMFVIKCQELDRNITDE